jgi:PPOX class probable F420-dependent enzyme
MATTIPESHRDILIGKNFANVATLMPDGSPQVTPVWIDFDGEDVLFNTVTDRQKALNLDRDGRVAISVFDSANPYRYISIRGVVDSKTTDGADANIDKLAKKYLGQDKYPYASPKDQRVIYRIKPTHVNTSG